MQKDNKVNLKTNEIEFLSVALETEQKIIGTRNCITLSKLKPSDWYPYYHIGFIEHLNSTLAWEED